MFFLEVCNIGTGSASTVLSKLLNRKVTLAIPTAQVIDSKEFDYPERPCIVTTVEFVEGLKSSNTFIISKQAALVMANLMLGGTGEVDEDAELTELELSAMQEVMNQMMGYSATAMSEMLGKKIDISPPIVEVCNVGDAMIQKDIDGGKTVEVIFPLEVESLIKTPMYQIFNPELAKEIAHMMLSVQEEVQAETPVEEVVETPPAEPIQVEKATPQISTTETEAVIDSIPITLEVIFGTAKVKLADFITWCEKDIVILKESYEQPLSLLANGIHIGSGTLVRVNDHFGIKITELEK